MNIPKDTILMISGVSCVGKTTVAYEILKTYPEFRRVSELDMLRAVVRIAYENLAEESNINKDVIMRKYDALFKSITSNNFKITKLQSEQLLPYIKEIILRQQRRQIPTIIEGAGIIPSTYFPNNQPLDWLTKHVIFINLYLSDEKEHISRRNSRSVAREYNENSNKTKEFISQARTEKNILLHTETIQLHQLFDNVFSIDVSKNSPSGVANKMMELVLHYFL